jgi:enoyl-CoA hydratase/carnithine racemase
VSDSCEGKEEEVALNWKMEGKVAWLELDHGKANEMGSEQLRDFEALAETLDARALVTWTRRRSGRGTPIFIAGANVTERRGWSDDQVRAHVRWQRDVLARIRALPLFHVGVVHGVALGWGTEYLITCDYRIATEEAVFALPETGLGILPGAGGSSELWSLIGVPQALRMGMTGERLSAHEALRIGLVQEVVPDLDTGLERARQLVERVARNSPTSVAAFKRAVLGSVGLGPDERRELEAQAYEHCVGAGDAAIGRANFEKIRAGEPVPWGPRVDFKA